MLQQTLLEQVFTNIPSEGREAWLEDIVRKYPYFSTAHYFLLREKGGLESAPFQAAKTALHFSHPYLLQQRLQHEHLTMVDESPLKLSEEPSTSGNENEFSSEDAGENINIEGSKPEDDVAPVIVQKEKVKEDDKLTEMVFEPLHTTDYFASQGIKLSEEMLSQDKLGKQMRRFTDWLKTMKKIPGATDQVPVDISVKAIAENSNREEEVYTESMADVYIEQQKFGKARDIYTKLSLLNPSKSAYFAAKLEKIKDY